MRAAKGVNEALRPPSAHDIAKADRSTVLLMLIFPTVGGLTKSFYQMLELCPSWQIEGWTDLMDCVFNSCLFALEKCRIWTASRLIAAPYERRTLVHPCLARDKRPSEVSSGAYGSYDENC